MLRLGLGLSSPGDRSIRSVIPSAVFDLDATLYKSYPGSGNVLTNAVPSPADSSSSSAYNATKAGSGNFTFSGSAGSPSAYINFTGDAACRFQISSNTSFVNALHKTTGGSDFWIALAFRFQQNDLTQLFAGTQNSSNENGVVVYSASTENIGLRQGNGAANVTASLSNGVLVDNTDYLAIVSHSHSGNMTRIWLNTTTATEVAHTFGTTTSDAAFALAVGSGGNGGSGVPADARLYGFYGGNEYLDNTKAAKIFAFLESRHRRDYTP